MLHPASGANTGDVPAHNHAERRKHTRIDVGCNKSGHSNELQVGRTGLDGRNTGKR